jgi:hypothetical protein
MGSPPSPQYRVVCQALDEAIRAVAGVSNVRWYTQDEYDAGEKGGAEHPTG